MYYILLHTCAAQVLWLLLLLLWVPVFAENVFLIQIPNDLNNTQEQAMWGGIQWHCRQICYTMATGPRLRYSLTEHQNQRRTQESTSYSLSNILIWNDTIREKWEFPKIPTKSLENFELVQNWGNNWPQNVIRWLGNIFMQVSMPQFPFRSNLKIEVPLTSNPLHFPGF